MTTKGLTSNELKLYADLLIKANDMQLSGMLKLIESELTKRYEGE